MDFVLQCITFVVQKYYECITMCYICTTFVLHLCYNKQIAMKAKKTNPKSIRFNSRDLEQGLAKSGLESIQELVDFLLKEYTNKSEIKIDKPIQKAEPIKNKLSNIISSSGTKGYFGNNYMEDPNNLDGITNPSLPF